MDGRPVVILLRALHILGGIFWVGTMLAMTYFFGPAARKAGPDGGRFLGAVMQRLSTWLAIAAGTTVLSGILLYGRNMGLTSGAWGRSGPGIGFTVGALAAIAAFILGMSIARPTAARIGALAARMQGGGAPDPALGAEMAALQRRSATAATYMAGLLIVASLAMAVARYL